MLSNLQYLDVNRNRVSVLPTDLSGMTSLQTLHLEGNGSRTCEQSNSKEKHNGIKGLSDISPLTGLTNLKTLNVGYSDVESLKGLENLKKIETLFIYHNGIKSLEPIKQLTNITDLRADSNYITNISALGGMSKLSRLEIQNNNNQTRLGTSPSTLDISALAGKPLTYLNAFNNNIADASALSNVKTLKTLDLGTNRIADLSHLKAASASATSLVAALQFPVASTITRTDVAGKTELDISKLKNVEGKTPVINRVVVLEKTGAVSFQVSGNKIILPATYGPDIRVFYKAQGANDVRESQVDTVRATIPTPTPTPTLTPVKPRFVDVPSNYVFYKEISWLASTGITTGWVEADGSRTFRPETAVNRDVMAAFIYRYDANVARKK